MLILVINFK